MVIPILSTKIHLPAPPHELVPRARLISQLEAGTRKKLCLISAPAGFGKTSLLAEWAEYFKERCLISWVQLDELDNELPRFLSYLIAALQTQQEDLGEVALAGIGSMPPPPIEAILTSLINELDSIENRIVLILDDYHLIDNTAIHGAIDFLVTHLPEHMCLVIATRTDPPLPLHRLRARGQMTELRSEDLRFDQEESQHFLVGNLDYAFTNEDLAALDSRIEGWIAGLQMVAISLQGRQDIPEFISAFSGSHRYIMDYLSEEIYNQQPVYIQKFLLRTSLLIRLSGPLCDYILSANLINHVDDRPTPPAQQTLQDLERSNLFLIPLDEERIWYRYHHLFASLLRQRLHQTDPGNIEGLLQRASDWCAANGFFEEAFQYAIAAEDYQAAAEIVERQGLELLKKGTLATIMGWFTKLPEEIITTRPQLNVLYAWVLLLTGQTGDVEIYLRVAEEKTVNRKDHDELHGEIAAIRAYAAARREDIPRTLVEAEKAQALLPNDDFSVRSVVSFVLGGVLYMQGDLTKALDAMRAASRDGERSGNIHVAISARNAVAGILERQGKLVEAEATYLQALKLGTGRSGQPLPISASLYEGLGRLYLARNDLQKARKYARIGIDLGEQWVNADSQIHGLLTLAQIAQVEGNTDEVEQALTQVRQLAATHVLTPGTADLIAKVELQLQAHQGHGNQQSLLIEPLSERELEVLRLLVDGRSNSEIADKLIIALGTVKAHTSTIYRKLEVRGRTEAVLKARELGIL